MVKKKAAIAKSLGKRGKAWADYEDVAKYVLQEIGKRFGLVDVEGKQKLAGRKSGTNWEIDAKGVKVGRNSFLIVECRRYNSRLNQEALAAVAYRIDDTGAAGGITVSPFPLQKGAAKVAKSNNINHVELRPESTREMWVATVKDVILMGINEVAQLRVTESLEIFVIDENGVVVESLNLK